MEQQKSKKDDNNLAATDFLAMFPRKARRTS